MDRRKDIEELLDTSQQMRRKFSSLSKVGHGGITSSQWLVIGHIFRNEECTTNDVANALGMTGSAVTQLLNGLVAKGLVIRKRDERDRRALKLALSTTSKKKVQRLKQMRLDALLHAFKALTDEEFKHYIELNRKVIASLKK